jgi:hypothetical protein
VLAQDDTRPASKLMTVMSIRINIGLLFVFISISIKLICKIHLHDIRQMYDTKIISVKVFSSK